MVLLGGYKPFYQLLLSESAEEVCDFEGERGPLSAWGVACMGGLVLLETQCKQERKLARGHQGASYC